MTWQGNSHIYRLRDRRLFSKGLPEFRPIDPQVLKLVNAAKSPGSHPCPRSHTHRPCGRARAGIVRLPRTRAIRETYEHKLQVRTVHQRTLWLLPGTGSNFEVIMSGDS